MDRDITRGLLETLRHFFNPPRTYAQLDLQRAFLEQRPRVTVRQVHELLLHVPTTVQELSKLPHCASLLSADNVMPSMRVDPDANLEGQVDDGSGSRTLGLCLVEVIRDYLRGRSFVVDDDETVPVCHFVSSARPMNSHDHDLTDTESSPAASPPPEEDLEAASSTSSSSSPAAAALTTDDLLKASNAEELLSKRLSPNSKRYIDLLYRRLTFTGSLHLPLTAEQYALVQAISFALFGGRFGSLLEKGSGKTKLSLLICSFDPLVLLHFTRMLNKFLDL